VDEYQDTNTIQAQIICKLAGPTSNVMVVGDDSQSIYSFRGANFQNIMEFPNLFQNATIIKLEENYRSTQPILDLTNDVIANSPQRYTKTLFTRKSEGEKPVFIETQSENDQSRFVCQRILELREEGVDLNEMAVLVRSGWHSNDLEIELRSHNIPFAKYGGFKFVETSHVKDIVAYLRVVHNITDGVSWRRVLQLIDGVGPKAASDIFDRIKALPANLMVAISSFESRNFYSELMGLMGIILHSKNKKPAEIMDDILTYYQPLFQSKYDDYTKRKTDLDSIQVIAERFTSLDQFLSDMSLEPPDSSQVDSVAAPDDDEKLTLSTIHSAKGLEWDTVFLISAVDGYLPSFKSLNYLNQIEEERRLMYVALTRAKERLFIIQPHLEHNSGMAYRYSGMQFSRVSRFLEQNGVLDRHVEKYALVEEEVGAEDTVELSRPNYDDELPPADPNRQRYSF